MIKLMKHWVFKEALVKFTVVKTDRKQLLELYEKYVMIID